MHPLTADCPKPLLPVGPWTLLEHQIAALARAGAQRVVLSTGYRHEDFTDIVRTARAKGVDLATVVEGTPQGTGGGLREALSALQGAGEVLVVNGDLLTGHDLRAQVDRLRSSSPQVLGVVHVREVEDARPYGSILTDEQDCITAFVEKSDQPPSLTVNAGTYALRPGLLDRLPATGPVSLERDVFPQLAREGRLVAHREQAYFLDVGSPAALLRANRDLLLDPWPGAATTRRTQALVLPGALVHPQAELTGGTVVHEEAVIAAGARLDNALVLPGAVVDQGARVTRSVVGRAAHVGSGAEITDVALGTSASVSDGERMTGGTRPTV